MAKNSAAKMLEKTANQYQNQVDRAKRDHPNLAVKPPRHEARFTTDYILFNRMIGNPVSKITGVTQDMATFQDHYHDTIQVHHTMEYVKSRKLGATETWNRSCGLNCFDRYVGHDIMFIAGNEVATASEILNRFDELFQDRRHPDGYYAFKEFEPEFEEELDKGVDFYELQDRGTKIHHHDVIRRANFAQKPLVEFTNDTRCMAYAASRQEKAQSFRGADDVIAAFVSEAAHTGMKNDQPIMTALEPNLAQRDDGDLVLESTPNGRRGFFWDYWKETMRILGEYFHLPMTEHQTLVDRINALWLSGKKIKINVDWWPLMTDYKIGLQHHILSQKYIEKQQRNPKLDFDQEYCCKFTSTYTQAIKTEDLSFKNTADKDYKRSIDLLGKEGIDRDYGEFKYR